MLNVKRGVEVIERVFRNNVELALRLRELIRKFAEDIGGEIRIMNFCGTHEWTTVHFGIRSLMPKNVDLVAGPGCPVCITPAYYVSTAIRLALEGVRVYTFGDASALPTTEPVNGVRSLAEARAAGGDVSVVYSFLEAIADAARHGKDAVFLGIGFETTAPGYAMPLALGRVPENLRLISVVRLTPPAAVHALRVNMVRGRSPVMGVVAPGHVSTITGAKAWVPLAEEFKVPVVVSGFEPIDLLLSIGEILRQLRRGEAKVVVEYRRAVKWEGDVRAQKLIERVFDVVDSSWRGIGVIPRSGLVLNSSYERYDALKYYGVPDPTPNPSADVPPGCKCGEIIVGLAKPIECPLFMRVCTPSAPRGPCMVSNEGTCAIWARFGGGGLADEIARELGLS